MSTKVRMASDQYNKIKGFNMEMETATQQHNGEDMSSANRYKIEDNVPIPSVREPSYPLAQMKVNACMTVPLPDGMTIEELTRKVRNSISAFKRKDPSMKFNTRADDEGIIDPEVGPAVRIYRVK